MIKLKQLLEKTDQSHSDFLQNLVGNILLGANPKIAQLQGFNSTEPDTKWEKELSKSLENWVGLSTDKLANFLKNNKDILRKLAQKYPELLQPPTNQVAYRGSAISLSELKKLFITNGAIEVREIKEAYSANYTSLDFFIFSNVKYTPNRPAQSWTVSKRIAMGFEGILSWGKGYPIIYETIVDDDFIFNPLLLKTIFKKNEQETVRIGGALTVQAMVSTDLFLNALSDEQLFVHEIPAAKPFFSKQKKLSKSQYVKAAAQYVESIRVA